MSSFITKQFFCFTSQLNTNTMKSVKYLLKEIPFHLYDETVNRREWDVIAKCNRLKLVYHFKQPNYSSRLFDPIHLYSWKCELMLAKNYRRHSKTFSFHQRMRTVEIFSIICVLRIDSFQRRYFVLLSSDLIIIRFLVIMEISDASSTFQII